jgi:hypothetical protein
MEQIQGNPEAQQPRTLRGPALTDARLFRNHEVH